MVGVQSMASKSNPVWGVGDTGDSIGDIGELIEGSVGVVCVHEVCDSRSAIIFISLVKEEDSRGLTGDSELTETV